MEESYSSTEMQSVYSAAQPAGNICFLIIVYTMYKNEYYYV